MARMPKAMALAQAIRIEGAWERMNPITFRVATRNSWLRCHSRIRVAEPDNYHGEWQRDKQNPQTNVRARCVIVHNTLRGMCRFILQRLDVACE